VNPTGRFSGRAAVYSRYRPGYPEAIAGTLRQAGLPDGAHAADLGAGTGISSEFLLRHGCRVTAVEPNDDMRAASESWLGGRPGFRAVAGSAEQTGLDTASFDLVAAFQAGHWFNFAAALEEMERLAKPGGLLAFAWNLRSKDLSEFDRRLEHLLHESAVDYSRYEERRLSALGGLAGFHTAVFRHEQRLDWEPLSGLVQSWSYVPSPEHPRHGAFFDELRRLFTQEQREGVIVLRYDCHLYWRRAVSAS
jgi:SAM-dependent methyltransferase